MKKATTDARKRIQNIFDLSGRILYIDTDSIKCDCKECTVSEYSEVITQCIALLNFRACERKEN